MRRGEFLLPAVLALAAGPAPAADGFSEWAGWASGQVRAFAEAPAYPAQEDGTNLSFALQPDYYREWDGGRQSFTFVPFARYDNLDPERSHADIRELTWLRAADDWELGIGIRKVFWGVTESVHLVDIINQTDLVEDIDGEDKLGQPMVQLSLIRDWGTLEFFALPGFRERTFPGPKGRIRSEPPVDTGRTRFEAGNGLWHTDWAVRWSHTLGDWDIGLSHFYGTSRDPNYRLDFNDAGQPVLALDYPLINQTGLDVQATLGDWLWKLEWIRRTGQGNYHAAAGGFEYTFVGIAGTQMDLGLIGEYLYDSRPLDISLTPFEDDVMLGLRLAVNDEASTELLFGAIQDLDSAQHFYYLEASRRLTDHWKLNLEGRAFSGIDPGQPLFATFTRDDYLQAELFYYF